MLGFDTVSSIESSAKLLTSALDGDPHPRLSLELHPLFVAPLALLELPTIPLALADLFSAAHSPYPWPLLPHSSSWSPVNQP